jgi:hypothetical protein
MKLIAVFRLEPAAGIFGMSLLVDHAERNAPIFVHCLQNRTSARLAKAPLSSHRLL